jgi:hypothetical protein
MGLNIGDIMKMINGGQSGGESNSVADGLLSILPGGSQYVKNKRLDESLSNQTAAANTSAGYANQGYDFLKGLYEPSMQAGDRALSAMEQGVYGGAYTPSEGAFSGYTPYQAQQYTPQAAYQNRQQFNAPAGVQYDNSGAPTLSEYQKFSPGQQPQQEQLSYSQTQFSPYQQSTPAPDQYIAPDAQAANYYDPTAQDNQFSLEDDAGYQRRLEQSGKAIESSAAGRGSQLSGATLKALQENAQGLAADETAAAYGRYADTQNRIQNAQNYQNEDQYARYLDSVGIRGAEADKALAQWNTDRNFGQAANTENLSNALAVNSQNYGQNLGNRQQALNEYNANASNELSRYSALNNAYNQGKNLELATQGQNWNQAWAPYESNRNFDYGVYGDREAALQNAAQFNANQSLLGNQSQYQTAGDTYNRDLANKTNQYGMISDLANIGATGRNAIGTGYQNLTSTLSDLEMQKANAKAAAAAAKNQNTGILSWLGL